MASPTHSATQPMATLRRRAVADHDHRDSAKQPSKPPFPASISPHHDHDDSTIISNNQWRKISSIQSIFWIGFLLFTAILFFLIYYTTYYLPLSSEQQTNFLADVIDDNQTTPFGFKNYPFDTPYELRDISAYSKVVAIGDLHGDLSQTLKILQLTGIIDANRQWIAEDTVLVQTGDIVDRGNESIEVYKLFFDLREQAIKHGSLVLQILGNHEMMNLRGDYRYVTATEMYKYGSTVQWAEIWSMKHKIGYFLRNTPIVRIVGNTLFVHAGLRPDILSIVNAKNETNELNELVWKSNTLPDFDLNDPRNGHYYTLNGRNGPVWTRQFDPRFYNTNMFKEAKASMKKLKAGEVMVNNVDIINEYLCEQVEKTLDALNVKRMVIGHNVQKNGTPMSRCDGKLFSIDVGMSCAYGCNLGALAIDVESDIVSIVTP